jgi:hypothetical protein
MRGKTLFMQWDGVKIVGQTGLRIVRACAVQDMAGLLTMTIGVNGDNVVARLSFMLVVIDFLLRRS